jgi:hypothetical protein
VVAEDLASWNCGSGVPSDAILRDVQQGIEVGIKACQDNGSTIIMTDDGRKAEVNSCRVKKRKGKGRGRGKGRRRNRWIRNGPPPVRGVRLGAKRDAKVLIVRGVYEILSGI